MENNRKFEFKPSKTAKSAVLIFLVKPRELNIKLNINNIVLAIFLLTVSGLNGQDLHFSQFYFAPLQLNPALTGVFKEDIRFSANYRRQWKSVPVDYLTFSGVVDGKIPKFSFQNGFFSGGLVFNHDIAGDGNLTYSNLSATGSYTQKLTEQQLLTAGLQVGVGQRRIDLSQLTFGNQFNGDLFLGTAPTRENLDQTSIQYLDFGVGLNWHLQQEDQKYWGDLGIGVFHLTQPDVGFYNQNKTVLPRRYSIYGNFGFGINDKVGLEFNGYFQKQNTYTESVALGLRFGVSYRLVGARDALIPNIAVAYNAWLLGFSYDFNQSDFELATNGRGGPELALQYRITKVKPLKASKSCPIF